MELSAERPCPDPWSSVDPAQAVLMPITDKQADYVRAATEALGVVLHRVPADGYEERRGTLHTAMHMDDAEALGPGIEPERLGQPAPASLTAQPGEIRRTLELQRVVRSLALQPDAGAEIPCLQVAGAVEVLDSRSGSERELLTSAGSIQHAERKRLLLRLR